jgi:hypothetical protein
VYHEATKITNKEVNKLEVGTASDDAAARGNGSGSKQAAPIRATL